ncbi:hypothetical protein SAMN05444414_12054 [Roseovarius marisflavi]|uniref:Transposase n=1 Tax=Roseovarius marisflavi TaxID=1054996 RepID=A0A1M7BRI6_9RHOB|nr:hypothetical protein SAMN05444414_12054 [Roseovarius marisflavi]
MTCSFEQVVCVDTDRHQANATLDRVAIVRMRSHEPTLAYVDKPTKDGNMPGRRTGDVPEETGALKKDVIPLRMG